MRAMYSILSLSGDRAGMGVNNFMNSSNTNELKKIIQIQSRLSFANFWIFFQIVHGTLMIEKKNFHCQFFFFKFLVFFQN